MIGDSLFDWRMVVLNRFGAEEYWKKYYDAGLGNAFCAEKLAYRDFLFGE